MKVFTLSKNSKQPIKIHTKWTNESADLLLQHCVESEGEGDDEEEEDDEELSECVEDVGEHDHVDSQVGELLNEEHKVDPR